jgi:hypothetical protein
MKTNLILNCASLGNDKGSNTVNVFGICQE